MSRHDADNIADLLPDLWPSVVVMTRPSLSVGRLVELASENGPAPLGGLAARGELATGLRRPEQTSHTAVYGVDSRVDSAGACGSVSPSPSTVTPDSRATAARRWS